MGRLALGAVLLAGVVVFGFPLYWMVRGALISQGTWNAEPLVWLPAPDQLTTDAFGSIFASRQFRMGPVLANTALLAGLNTIFNVLFDCMAGFALAKMRFRGKRAVLTVLFIVLMVPFEGLMISLYLTVAKMGLANTLAGILLPMSASAFGIILMWKFFQSVPDELIEAAVVDGAGWGTILFRVAMPLAAPAVATVAVLSFLGGWDAFVWPMLITDPHSSLDVLHKVIASATMQSTGGSTEIEWPLLMAASLLSVAPVLVLFALAQRFFIAGLTGGAVKG
jgi:multiple sugar transport system permease protein